ncbi:MAG: S24 family peptidase [Rubricoccaceae bacterium]
MRARLTERQNQVYEFLRMYIRTNGKPPTIKEIGSQLGIKSTNGVHKMIVALEKKGYIRRARHEARGISLIGGEHDPFSDEGDVPGIALLKMTEGAGRRARPLTSETAEYPLPRARQQLLVDPKLLPDDVELETLLIVTAGDDGMSQIGIWKGDVLVVEETAPFDLPPHALIAVLLYDRLVIRRFEVANRRFHFRSPDRTYTDESADPDDTSYFVIGQVLAVMRKLG